MKICVETTKRVKLEPRTDRERARAQQRRERERQCTQAALLGLWELDASRREFRWDEQTQAILSQPTDITTFDEFISHVDPADRGKVEAQFAGAMAVIEPRRYQLEFRYSDAAGLRWLQTRGNTVFKEINGTCRPVGICGAMLDITERKNNERQWEFLAELSATLSRLSEPAEIMGAATQALGVHLGAERCFIFESIPGDCVRVAGVWGRSEDRWLPAEYHVADFGGRGGWDALQQGPHTIVDTRVRPEAEARRYAGLHIGASASAPFLREGRCVAGVCVTSREPRRWTALELDGRAPRQP